MLLLPINHDLYITYTHQLMTSLYLTLILTFSFIAIVHSQDATNITSTTDTTYDITRPQAWGFGFLTGTGLSLLGFVAAILVVALKNVISEKNFKIFANLLYSLGCGAMVGDAMIHILPDSYKNEQVNFRFVALIFISAIGVFIGIERLFVLCGVAHQHWGDEDDGHSHGE